jgi:cytidylate kinase
MSKKTVILISREYGSGGRGIGEKLAKELNIPFYDKEVIRLACQESGFDVSLFENTEEQTKSPLSYLLSMYYATVSPSELSLNDQVFLIQSKVIRDLAKESCVIIGRCADYILKDHDDVLRIFVHADLEDRIERVIDEYGDEDDNIKGKITRIDKNRATYYNYYSNRRWGDLANYDLSLNTSKVDVDTCVALIKNIVENK